jgi:acetyl esterase/lipase
MNDRLLARPGCAGANAGSACITAGKAAVPWLRANAATYGIDPDRIAIGAESAGGITAAGVGLAHAPT